MDFMMGIVHKRVFVFLFSSASETNKHLNAIPALW